MESVSTCWTNSRSSNRRSNMVQTAGVLENVGEISCISSNHRSQSNSPHDENNDDYNTFEFCPSAGKMGTNNGSKSYLQSLKHSFKEDKSNPGLKYTDLINRSLLGFDQSDMTQDSSGIGSLLSDPCNSSHLSGLLKAHNESACALNWPDRNLTPLELDTSELGMNKSSGGGHAISQLDNSPINKSEYPSLGRMLTSSDRLHLASPVTSTNVTHEPTITNTVNLSPIGNSKQLNQFGSESDFDYDAMVAQTQLLSNQDAQMLDENLASVAKYVEELTGCGGPSQVKQTHTFQRPSPPRLSEQMQYKISQPQQVQQRQQQQQQQRLEELVCDRDTDVQQSLTNHQLAQLYQKLTLLSLLRNENVGERDNLVTQAQELISRSLTNQSTMQSEPKWEQTNWSSSPSAGQARFTPNQSIKFATNSTDNLRTGRRIVRHDSQSGHGPMSPAVVPNSILPDHVNESQRCFGTSASQTTSIGSRNLAQTRRLNMPPVTNSSINPNLLNQLLSQLGTLSNSGSSTPGPSSQPNLTTSTTLALLSNLLGMNQQTQPIGQTSMNGPTADLNTNNMASLANLLASLQQLPNHSSTSTSPNRINRDMWNSGFDELAGPPPSTSIQVPNLVGKNNFNGELSQIASSYQQHYVTFENDIEKAANMYRNSASTVAQKSEAAYHWSGKFSRRLSRSMTFSRKIFLGGVPWDSTSEDLISAFSKFGNVMLSWPKTDGGHSGSSFGRSSPKGYCYLIFENESSVYDLLDACMMDPNSESYYYKISSNKFKSKDVEVIPWVVTDSQFTKSGAYRPDSKRTVFIGALHAMITAEALVTIMNDLFGNVVFAALDTDKYKYPIGSGRVTFSSHRSYMRAVTANFVDVRTPKFIKTIQIDPYLEDSVCKSCFSSPGIYFCRDFDCFRYFCPSCWQLWHSFNDANCTHKPLCRTFKPVNERYWN